MSKIKEEKIPKSRKLNHGEYIKLGMLVRDTITDAIGTAYYRSEFIQGCDHIGIALPGTTEDGKMKDLFQTDVLNLEILVDQKNAFDPPQEYPRKLYVGDFVVDQITGREGIITSYSLALFEVPSVAIQPRGMSTEGKPKSPFYVEETRCKLIKAGPKHGEAKIFSEYISLDAPDTKPEKGGPVMHQPPQRR